MNRFPSGFTFGVTLFRTEEESLNHLKWLSASTSSEIAVFENHYRFLSYKHLLSINFFPFCEGFGITLLRLCDEGRITNPNYLMFEVFRLFYRSNN